MFWRVTATRHTSELVTRTPSAGCALSQGGECQRPRAGGPEAPSGGAGAGSYEDVCYRLASTPSSQTLLDTGHTHAGMCPKPIGKAWFPEPRGALGWPWRSKGRLWVPFEIQRVPVEIQMAPVGIQRVPHEIQRLPEPMKTYRKSMVS